jgi:hypothetical protein
MIKREDSSEKNGGVQREVSENHYNGWCGASLRAF